MGFVIVIGPNNITRPIYSGHLDFVPHLPAAVKSHEASDRHSRYTLFFSVPSSRLFVIHSLLSSKINHTYQVGWIGPLFVFKIRRLFSTKWRWNRWGISFFLFDFFFFFLVVVVVLRWPDLFQCFCLGRVCDLYSPDAPLDRCVVADSDTERCAYRLHSFFPHFFLKG